MGNSYPQFRRRGLYRKLKARRHHPDNGIVLAVEVNDPAEYMQVGTKFALPETMT